MERSKLSILATTPDISFTAGFDNIPLQALKSAGIQVARIPAYSPSSIAEYALSSILALSKNIQKSYEMTKAANFTIGGLQCILLEDKVAGVIGTGLIGRKTAQKLSGLFKKVLCCDAFPSKAWIKGVPNTEYTDQETLLRESDVISIHVPLLPGTKHLINRDSIAKMKRNVILVNTSRGDVVHTADLVKGIKSGKIFGTALDVFEGEKAFIFKDLSERGFKDHPDLKELAGMQNVIISSHVAFYTDEAIGQISEKTLRNYEGFLGIVAKDEKAFVI